MKLRLAMIAVVAIALLLAIKSSFFSTAQDQAPAGSTASIAQGAIAGGQQQTTIPITVNYEAVDGLDDALSRYSVVTARAVSQHSYADSPYTVSTWFRFAVVENLSSKPKLVCPDCPGVPAPPAALLPVGSNEILVPLDGGTTVRDGVTINYERGNMPDFKIGATYLLFLNLDSSTRVGALQAGPVGVSEVINNDALTTVAGYDGEDGLHRDIATRHNNSLTSLRASFQPTAPTPTPTGCYPTTAQFQECKSRGMFFDTGTCSCQYP